jgi:hypothetical protein
MKNLLIGAAAIAVAASPLAAQDKGHGKGQPAAHGNAAHGPSMQAMDAKGPAKHAQEHGNAGHGNSGHGSGSMASAMEAASPGHGNGNGNGKAKAHSGGPGAGKGMAQDGNKASRHDRSATAHAGRPGPQTRPGKDVAMYSANGNARAEEGVRVLKDGRHYYTRHDPLVIFDFAAARRGLVDGCPPGLAKKNNGCLPPGRAKQRAYRPEWWGLAGAPAGTYAYDDGYLMRLNGDRVAGYFPLLGGALAPGNIWPSYYAPVPVPDYYVDYYDLGRPGGYRYADNVLYRVDPSTAAITSIAALLTGDTFQVGSALPAGYDVYNVPYNYRSQYPDGRDARYRYSDGYIYQVDPTTQLVTAAIDLLAAA